jgi:hypothetical protein
MGGDILVAMNTLKTISEIVAAFGTLIVAGIVAYIAYRQHKTDKSKLKLDLYDRRLHIFESGMRFIAHVVQNGDADDQSLAAVNRARLEGMFLFPKHVAKYYAKLYENGIDLQYANKALRGETLNVDAERPQNAQKHAEIVKWFAHQFKALQDLVRPFIGFQE